MNLKQIEAFVHIAENGSFSKAAKELFLTQPTVSAHISSLEKELDVRLFVRNTKEVRLSEEGKMLYEYAKQMVLLEKQIEKAFDVAGEEKQNITIAASTVPAQYLLPVILARFNEKYPNKQFSVMETDSRSVVEQVENHTVDIGFTGTVLAKKHCKYIPFYRDELVIITPNNEKYRALKESDCDTDWIAQEHLVMREEGSGTRKEAEKQLKKKGIDLEKLNIVASMRNQEAIKKSVSNGMGVSIISKLAATDEVKEGCLLAFPLTSADDARDINIVYNKNFHLSNSSEKFVKVVKDVYRR